MGGIKNSRHSGMGGPGAAELLSGQGRDHPQPLSPAPHPHPSPACKPAALHARTHPRVTGTESPLTPRQPQASTARTPRAPPAAPGPPIRPLAGALRPQPTHTGPRGRCASAGAHAGLRGTGHEGTGSQGQPSPVPCKGLSARAQPGAAASSTLGFTPACPHLIGWAEVTCAPANPHIRGRAPPLI